MLVVISAAEPFARCLTNAITRFVFSATLPIKLLLSVVVVGCCCRLPSLGSKLNAYAAASAAGLHSHSKLLIRAKYFKLAA